jgi:double-stranded uracil-DNA glycosylase
VLKRARTQELLAAAGKTLPDVIASGLRMLFCGINPGLYTAAAGHHFARPGNRFWPALYRAGFTDRLLAPFKEHELLDLGWRSVRPILSDVHRDAAPLSPLEANHAQRAPRLVTKKNRARHCRLTLRASLYMRNRGC